MNGRSGIAPGGTAMERRRPGTIERAFELARTGSCTTLRALERRLDQEQHEDVVQHLWGQLTRRQLREAMASARQRTGEAAPR